MTSCVVLVILSCHNKLTGYDVWTELWRSTSHHYDKKKNWHAWVFCPNWV